MQQKNKNQARFSLYVKKPTRILCSLRDAKWYSPSLVTAHPYPDAHRQIPDAPKAASSSSSAAAAEEATEATEEAAAMAATAAEEEAATDAAAMAAPPLS